MFSTDDDVFDLANSLSDLLSAPVTIEDRDAAVVAYSGGQQEVDAARIATILGRRVPEHYHRALVATGVFDAIAGSDEVSYVHLLEAEMSPRAVIAARADGVLVGSIWAAVPDRPTPEQQAILASAAPVVGRAIARAHHRVETEQRRRQSALTTLLGGGPAAAEAADRLGLHATMQVVAMQAAEPGADLDGPVDLHLSAVLAQVVCAEVDRTLYAVVVAEPSVALHVLGDLQRRFHANGRPLSIGLGRPVSSAADLAASRDDADRLLRAMLRRSLADVVGSLTTHYADLLVDHSMPFLSSHGAFGPLVRLGRLEDDEQHVMRQTLEAHLDHDGDVAAAAAVLHVHPNTVRNRLRRARDTCDIDLDDASTRLALTLELRADHLP